MKQTLRIQRVSTRTKLVLAALAFGGLMLMPGCKKERTIPREKPVASAPAFQRMEAVELLKKLVSIDSQYPNEQKLAVFLENYLQGLGFTVKRQEISEGRYNLIAERGTTGKPIAFYAHMDTVESAQGWKIDPFKVKEEGDKLYGLGTWDMKAGIGAILKAVEKPTNRKIKIVFGVDEENISEGVQALIRSGFLDGVEGVIVPEAGNSEKEHLGPRMITLGRRGRAVYSIEVTGLSAHGATKKGVSALSIASRVVQFLESLEMRTHPKLPQASQFVRKMCSEGDGLSTPEKAIIELDRHLVPPETFESVLKELQKALEQFNQKGAVVSVSIRKRKTPYLPPYETNPEDPFVRRVVGIMQSLFGSVNYNYGLSVADENAIASLGIPVVTIGPKGADDHSPNEWVSKTSYLELIRLFERIISE